MKASDPTTAQKTAGVLLGENENSSFLLNGKKSNAVNIERLETIVFALKSITEALSAYETTR